MKSSLNFKQLFSNNNKNIQCTEAYVRERKNMQMDKTLTNLEWKKISLMVVGYRGNLPN